MFKLFFKFSDALMMVPFYRDNGLMYKYTTTGLHFGKSIFLVRSYKLE